MSTNKPFCEDGVELQRGKLVIMYTGYFSYIYLFIIHLVAIYILTSSYSRIYCFICYKIGDTVLIDSITVTATCIFF